MKNMATDLRDNLFVQMDWLTRRDIKGDDLKEEIQRQLAFNELAKTTVTTLALIAKCADTLYGLPVSEELRLIPPSPAETPMLVDGKRRSLLKIPKAGEE